MPKEYLSDQVLIQLAEQEWSDQRIADQYGVTRQAVQRRRVKLLGKKQTIAAQVNELLRVVWPAHNPTDERGHNRYYPIRMLRVWLRLQYGDKVPKKEERDAKAWVAKMSMQDTVLRYDPSKEQVWYVRDRRPSDGRLLIDWPEGKPFPTRKFKKALEIPEGPVDPGS